MCCYLKQQKYIQCVAICVKETKGRKEKKKCIWFHFIFLFTSYWHCSHFHFICLISCIFFYSLLYLCKIILQNPTKIFKEFNMKSIMSSIYWRTIVLEHVTFWFQFFSHVQIWWRMSFEVVYLEYLPRITHIPQILKSEIIE